MTLPVAPQPTSTTRLSSSRRWPASPTGAKIVWRRYRSETGVDMVRCSGVQAFRRSGLNGYGHDRLRLVECQRWYVRPQRRVGIIIAALQLPKSQTPERLDA